MKRIYLALTFLALCIGLCIFEQYTVENTYNRTSEYIEQAIEYTDKEDYQSAKAECKKLTDFWNKRYPYLSAMIEHGTLDDAGITIYSLEEMAQEKSEDLKENLIDAKNQIKMIRENQRISPGNIL